MSSFPTCQVCQQQLQLKGPAPFLLPCLHAVCETCVTSVVGGVISCSTCERDVNLTETPLQKDVIREKEILHLTVQHNPELVLCTHADDGNQAVCWCKECEDFLCEHCQNVHDSFKITKQHTIYDVGELEVGNLNEDRYCRVHPKFIADTWDTNCCMLTCRKCRHGDHSDHDAVDVEEAGQTSRRAAVTFLEEVQSCVEQHKAQSTSATEYLQKAIKSSSIFPDKISHTFNSMKTLIDQREVELRISHQQRQETVEKHLHKKKHSSDIFNRRCQTISDYINKTLKYSSIYEIVELRPLLEEKSNGCRSSAPSEDFKSLPLPVFNTEGLLKIKSTLQKFGAITTDDDVQENQNEDMGQTEHNVEETEQLEEELQQSKTSENKLARNTKEMKTGFIYWMDMRLLLFILTVAEAIILTVLFQQISDYETQAEMMTHKYRQMKKSEENLIKEKWEIAMDFETQTEILTQRLRQMETAAEIWIKEKNEIARDCDKRLVILTQKLREVEMSKENLIKEKSDIARELDSSMMNEQVKSFVLKRPQVAFSRTRYNADEVHINHAGELINKPQPNPPHNDQRLKKYAGTSSTAPLLRSGSPQYWELKTRVVIIKNLRLGRLLLEIGLTTEEEQDQIYAIRGQSYSLVVSHCTEHSSICRRVWGHDKYLVSLPDTLENTAGTSVTLHYGVVYDLVRQRIAFLDLKNEVIIGKIGIVDSCASLWPMFGVYNRRRATVSMSLVVGNDIDMTESKKALILESLE